MSKFGFDADDFLADVELAKSGNSNKLIIDFLTEANKAKLAYGQGQNKYVSSLDGMYDAIEKGGAQWNSFVE